MLVLAVTVNETKVSITEKGYQVSASEYQSYEVDIAFKKIDGTNLAITVDNYFVSKSCKDKLLRRLITCTYTQDIQKLGYRSARDGLNQDFKSYTFNKISHNTV